MSTVNHIVDSIDSQVWHWMAKKASTHPHSCRFLALPIAAGTFIRDILAPPAKCIEETIWMVRSIKLYREKNNRKVIF